MLPNFNGLSLRRCAPTMVNFQDTKEAKCLLCHDLMHSPLSDGLEDPRLGLPEFKTDPNVLQRWSWSTAVLRCGHRFHRRCLAWHFGSKGQAANQNPRVCPAGADQHNPPTPLSAADNADINTDIAAKMNEETPLDDTETERFEDGKKVVERGVSAVDVPALRAQAQTAQEEARAANARYRDVQKALEDAKQDYAALKAQATRLAQQPPPMARQSSAEALVLRDNVVTLQELLRQQQREMDDLRSEKMVRENADAEMVNEANRQRTAQGMEAERLRRQYALELDNVARLEADQRRLETSLETLKRQLRADESDLARASDLEAERDELQRALVVARSNLQKFRENAKSSAVAYRAKTSEELEELRKKVEDLNLQLQSEPEPAPAPDPAPADADLRRMEVLSDADEGKGESERYTPPSSSSSSSSSPPPPEEEPSTSSGNSEADRYVERERQPEQQLEANRPKTEAEKARERKQKAKAARDTPEGKKVKQEREKATANAKARELAEAKASAERQKEANRKRAEEKKRAKAEAQAEREAAEKAFKAKQKQPKDANAPILEEYVMVPTFTDERLVLLKETANADIRDLKEDVRQLVVALKNFVTITPGGVLDSIDKRLELIVDATPTLFSVLDNVDLLTKIAVATYFKTFLGDYEALHRNAGHATTELEAVTKFLGSATREVASSEAHEVAHEKATRLKKDCILMQRHVWSLLSLFFTREGLDAISTRWDLNAVMVEV